MSLGGRRREEKDRGGRVTNFGAGGVRQKPAGIGAIERMRVMDERVVVVWKKNERFNTA